MDVTTDHVTKTPARHCPMCGAGLPDRAGKPGRPAAWCSKTCRQGAHRARQAAARAAERAAALRGRLPAAHAELQQAEAELAYAYGRAANQSAEPGTDLVDHLTGPGWEMPLQDAARRLTVAAGRLGELAAEHARARADYRAALATFRRAPAPVFEYDETPDDSPAGPAAAEVSVSDLDELFDAAEDVITAAITEALPADLAAALAPQLRRLEVAFQDAAGDDPGPLAAAAADLGSHLTPTAVDAGEVPAVLVRLAAAVKPAW